jgi:hypothetical protein
MHFGSNRGDSAGDSGRANLNVKVIVKEITIHHG